MKYIDINEYPDAGLIVVLLNDFQNNLNIYVLNYDLVVLWRFYNPKYITLGFVNILNTNTLASFYIISLEKQNIENTYEVMLCFDYISSGEYVKQYATFEFDIFQISNNNMIIFNDTNIITYSTNVLLVRFFLIPKELQDFIMNMTYISRNTMFF